MCVSVLAEFVPDVGIIDLRMATSAEGDLNRLTLGRPMVAISFAVDESAKEQVERLGARSLLTKWI
jgi:hypothetical protein